MSLHLLSSLGLAFIFAPERMNSIIDVIAPLYTIIIVCGIFYVFRFGNVALIASSISTVKGWKKDRVYTLQKGASDSLSWKQSFAGKWEMISREGFYEGKTPAVASQVKDKPFGNIISFKGENDSYAKIDSTGVLATQGPWVQIGGPAAEIMSDKQLNYEKIFWDEERKLLLRTRDCPSGGYIWNQTRRIGPDGLLYVECKTTKTDGSSCSFTMTMKRLGD